ncbi:signal transduction histidine kinase/CheY-like chemotaxis protein [Paenibacillus endophyticus]|uniref:histidine kinase n=1 Tax=Paenibacillus endophyticus TaxID=1294268 RepID=A0A7W5G9P5_9BACL|nr:ATP-binding protein [Paenibacillus endophyticus]MBB3151523.1 signal transduction histidine kinase/CheY-like chemotaxis protein [Paenibacillus endophyticus]
MGKLRRYLNKRITRQFVAMMVLSLSLILFGAVFVLVSAVLTLKSYTAETTLLRQKQELVSEIADHSNEVILRARGYYVYLSDYEYDQIFAEKVLLDKNLVDIKKLKLTASEEEVMRNIEDFFTNYFDELLPKAIEYSKSQDYQALRVLISAGEDNPVNKLITYSHDLESQVRLIAEQKNDQLIERLSYQALLFIAYIVFILVLSSLLTRRVAKAIGVPLLTLTSQARNFANGEYTEVDLKDRADELGELARTFHMMLTQIQSNEEELVAQNEELIAQQDELQAQQEELQLAVEVMEQNEKYLLKRNKFIQSLSSTLDQTELLESIITNIVSITESEKGIIVKLDREHEYASVGISEDAALQFIENRNDGILLRALQTKKSYSITRDCYAGEKGYHDNPMKATDLVLPILNASQEIVACVVITKVNREISMQEEVEIAGLMTQVSLAFDKLQLYEISEKQRLMTSDMLDTIQEGIQLLDLDGTTRQINRKMSDILPFFTDAEQTVMMTDEQLKNHIRTVVAQPEMLIPFIEGLVQSGHYQGMRSITYEVIEPERRFIQLYCEPLYRNGIKFGLLLVHRDITKEYEVDRMKSEFVSTVSHELRTPLASVLGFAELLLHRELKPERQRKYMTTIHQEARRLTTLINDFLDLQRMESGKQTYELKLLSLTALITEAVDMQQLSAPNHHIQVRHEAPSTIVLADRDKMHQVIINLLSNAIKYSPNGGQIDIVSGINHNQFYIRIEDHGLGIPTEAMKNLFNKFYRVDNTDRREIGGTGLGLAIVKEIVTKHEGKIEVQSEFGKGSIFTVTLPIAEQPNPIISEESNIAAWDETSIQVMLVENDNNLATLLSDELLASGYMVHLFKEGALAIEAIEELNPDIVVVDLMLESGVTGWDLISKIKKTDLLLNLPIIISSAFEEKDKASQWGITEFLVKPYLPGRLSAAISRLLR